MLNLNSVILFSENPAKLVEFYTKVFQKDPEWSGGDFHGWVVGDGMFTVGPHDKVKGKNKNPERMMFNLETDDVSGEFKRLQDGGATPVQEPYHPGEEPDMWISTLADPDGNYFQVVSPMEK